MPTTKKTPASKAAPQTNTSTSTKLTAAEQAREELTADTLWPQFKGKVVASACRLYQKGKLKSADDISAMLNPLQNELRDAIGIATGIAGSDIRDKLITLIVNDCSLSKASFIMQQVAGISISAEEAKSIILAHQEEFTDWYTASLKDRYYPLVFLHKNYVMIPVGDEHPNTVGHSYMYTALGITEDGMREVISFHMDPPINSEGHYIALLRQLKERELPAPLLITGKYEDNFFCQTQLKEFFPQSYFIPNRKDTAAKVSKEVPAQLGRRQEYKSIIKGIYNSHTLEQFDKEFDLDDDYWWYSLDALNDTLREVFCPEVAKALVNTPDGLRKRMFEKPPFGKEVERIEPILMQSGVNDVTQLSILMHQYYEQVLRKEWQRTVSSWSRLKGDLQAFAQAMQ